MRHFLTITIMFMSVGASAQFTDFASITMDERNLKSCSLDPEARAVDKTLFTVGEYGQVQDFFKQMVNMMNELVILKKKQ